MKTTRVLLSAAFLAAGLAACGGDSSVSPPGEVPANAAASPDAYTQYVRDMPTDETSEPLGLNLFAQAPTTEDGDTLEVN